MTRIDDEEGDGPVTNPSVPLCRKCNSRHFPTSECPRGDQEPGE